MVRSGSGGSGEGRLGVRVIPAKGGRGLDRVWSESSGRRWGNGWPKEFGWGSTVEENSGEEKRQRLGVARRKKRQAAGKRGSARVL
jgi:hypothetical protein